MKQIKVLGIVGSPRKGGNTDIIIDEILKGAKKNGANTEKILLSDLTINPCDGCNVCFKTGECKHKDDFTVLKDKLNESEVWIIGTPVYWWGPTAILKAFIDRWYEYELKRQFFHGKRMILVIASGGSSESYSRHIIGMMEDITQYLGINLEDKIVCIGVSRRGDVKNKPELLKKALELGMKLTV